MVNDDLVKCPLCGGFTHIERPELLAALHDPTIRKRIETYVAELLQSPSGEHAAVAGSQPHALNSRDVHNRNWNTPLWSRSPKE
jgi:hypothetical protein